MRILRPYLLIVLGVWAVGTVAAYLYAQQIGVSWGTVVGLLPAFLLEAAFYVALGRDDVRAWLERRPPAVLGFVLWVTALAPFVLAGLERSWQNFAWLAAGTFVASFWFVVLPAAGITDALFLLLLTAVMLTKVFDRLYPDPVPKLHLEILGQLMLIRTAAFAFLCLRRVKGVGFGFLPTKRDWAVGAGYYVLFLPFATGLGLWLKFMTLRWPPHPWWKASLIAFGTFLGILWVVALSEEFIFRGLLQQWLSKWLHNEWAGLLAASALFGSVHLWYRAFPNWRFAVLAGVAGIFYGLAFRSGRGIRASMVTHALVVTTWKTFGA
ncbi:MAG: CPBP family intramembrane glutamic endopeptidase [Bryobacteraceae bacterium]